MGKIIFSLIIGLFFLYPQSVAGQHVSKIDLIVNGGIGIPADPAPWSDNWKWGLTGGAGISYRFSPHISIGAHIDYHSFLFDDYNFSGRLPFTEHIRDIEAQHSSIIGVSAEAKYMVLPFSENLSPYVTAGVGFQRFFMSDIYIAEYTWDGFFIYDETLEGSTSYGAFIIAGGGLNIASSESRSYFIEVRYGIGFSEDEPNHFLPIRIGFRHRLY